ncbi:hypothetical protein FQR65_LT19635 [Abscondita terminalis]|nr:hypothetical protein FQR65_LT19635 [Abscondita terminalis]
MKKKLILESGEVFHGVGFGANTDTEGEVVFNTDSMYGHMPLIGNYGINRDDYGIIEPAMKGKIVDENADEQAVVEKLKATTFPTNQIEAVSTKTNYASPGRGLKVVLVDFGAKLGILRELTQRDCDVTVVSQDMHS